MQQLFRASYRTLLKNARSIDENVCTRILLSAPPQKFYDHGSNEWVGSPQLGPDDVEAKATVERLMRDANGGRDLYLPGKPSISVSAVVRNAFRQVPPLGGLNAVFRGIKVTNNVLDVSRRHSNKEDVGATQVPKFEASDLLPLTHRESSVGLPAPSTAAAGTATLLIAHPWTSPFFRHSVILVLRRDDHGTIGIIINKPLYSVEGSYLPVWSVVPSNFHPLFNSALAQNSVMIGGPVASAPSQKQALFLVHKINNVTDATSIGDGLFMSGKLDEIDAKIRAGEASASDCMVVLGYAGWGTGQLEGEIAQGAWVTATHPSMREVSTLCNRSPAPATGSPADVVADPLNTWCRCLESLGDPMRGLQLAHNLELVEEDSGSAGQTPDDA